MEILSAINESIQTIAIVLMSGSFIYLIIKPKEHPIERIKIVKKKNQTRPNTAKTRPFSYSDSELADLEEQEQ